MKLLAVSVKKACFLRKVREEKWSVVSGQGRRRVRDGWRVKNTQDALVFTKH
jgi:hypothetical protein